MKATPAPASPPPSAAAATTTTTTTDIFPSAELRQSPRTTLRPKISGSSLFAMGALNATIENEVPEGVTRADVAVDVRVSLERPEDKENKSRADLAQKVRETAERQLAKWYTGELGTAACTLKVYVVLAREGSMLNALTLGKVGDATEECLEWFLQASDGSKTYMAGRVGDKERLLFTNREQELTDRFPQRLVQEIVEKINIRNRSAEMKHQL
jgi:hypothetical protein